MFDALQRQVDDAVAAAHQFAATLDRVAADLADNPADDRLFDEFGGRPSEHRS